MRLLLYIGALLVVALIAIGIGWAIENYRARPQPETFFDDPRLSFRPAAHLARHAVREFRALSAEQQQALRDELNQSLTTVELWARERVDAHSLLCIGERHENRVREFIANEMLPQLNYQTLMLETSQAQLKNIIARHQDKLPVTLLDASLSEVLDASVASNPTARITAIDEPQPMHDVAQSSAQTASLPRADRESSLVARIRDEWRREQRHIILFGALHCRSSPGWMMHELTRGNAQIHAADIINAVVLARYQESSAQVLMYFLDEVGLAREVVVIADTSQFPALIQQWLPLITDAFVGYDSAILFDDRAMQLR